MKRLIILPILFISVNMYAQFTLSGEIRPRSEFRHGYKQLPTDDTLSAFHISQRTRLNFEYENDNIKSKISFQDVRLWGDEKFKTDNPGFGLKEAWLDYKMGESFSIKLGRQTLKYDNQRILAGSNWNQVGASHDAIVLKFNKSGFEFHVGSSFNQTTAHNFGTDYDKTDYYKTMNLLWLKKETKFVDFSTLNIIDGYQKEGTTNTLYVRGTSSLGFDFKLNPVKISMRGFYQYGKTKTGMDISSWLTMIDLSYKINDNILLTAGNQIFSGDNNENPDDKYNSFDIMYGSKHKYNGLIDYFNTPKTSGYSGLIDTHLGLKAKITKKITLNAVYHYFMLQNKFIDNGTVINKSLASEIDIFAGIKLRKQIDILVGYSLLKGTNSLEIIQGGGNSDNIGNFAYIQFTYKPVFLNK